ncbi:MAG: Fe-S-binding domain-containing protein, partial [Candidatus Neomarinimicrobiota bacterium]
GLNGFVGEFLIIVGSFNTQPVGAIVAATGVILSAVYLLWLVHRVFFGPPGAAVADVSRAGDPLSDLTRREWAVILPILVMIVMLGVYPRPFLSRIEPAVDQLVNNYHKSVAEVQAPAGQEKNSLSFKELE